MGLVVAAMLDDQHHGRSMRSVSRSLVIAGIIFLGASLLTALIAVSAGGAEVSETYSEISSALVTAGT